jgi:hypothetical protein
MDHDGVGFPLVTRQRTQTHYQRVATIPPVIPNSAPIITISDTRSIRSAAQSAETMDLDAPTTPPNFTAGEANDLTPASRAQLHVLLRQAEGAYGSAEAAVIFLMHKYQFSFDDLRHTLRDEQLDVSFSKAKYSEIAMFYNLNPRYHMWDADRFHMKRARIPTDVFQRIVSDIDLMLQVYGPPELHGTEDARSRFLAPLWHHIVAKFGMLVRNTPETMIQGRITTQGRIEYQFRSFGSLTVLFIELKMFVGDLNERMNAIAQVRVWNVAVCRYNWLSMVGSCGRRRLRLR